MSEELKPEFEQLRTTAKALLDACYLADAHEDLTHWIDGSHMDNLANAIEATYPVVFTADEVAQLKEWQANPKVHPLTCGGNRSDEAHRYYAEENDEDMGQLIPTPRGLLCPVCDYRQTHFPLQSR